MIRAQDRSRPVTSAQTGPHDDLIEIAQKHLSTPYRRPMHDRSVKAVDELLGRLAKMGAKHLILDAGCGTGDSTRHLAGLFPDHFIIGVDKSEHRLKRERASAPPDNMLTTRIDLVDFYRLWPASENPFAYHFVLFPNPWPKPQHLKRRWHGHPVFPAMMAVSQTVHLRTNWPIYADEFSLSATLLGFEQIQKFDDLAPGGLTPFELKYSKSGQAITAVTMQKGS